MKEELTTEMHSEFSVDFKTEILHRCITLWCYAGADDSKPGFKKLCDSYGLSVDVALANKDYCLSLKSDKNGNKK